MAKFEFKPEDFEKQKLWDAMTRRPLNPYDVILSVIAEIASARLKQMLEEAPTVFAQVLTMKDGTKYCSNWNTYEQHSGYTHTGKVVCIEPTEGMA